MSTGRLPVFRIVLAAGALLSTAATQAVAASAPLITTVGRPVVALTASDVDGDGRQDLVTAQQLGSFFSTSVVVLPGDGRGGFATGIPRPTTLNPSWLAVGRLDGDRLPDLAMSSTPMVSDPFYGHAVTSLVGVALGSPRGGFGRVTPLGSVGPGGVVIGDFNGDGHGDVAGSGLVSLGDGEGGFAPVDGPGPAIDGLGHFTIGDFDRDMRQDLAYIESLRPGVVIVRGRGDGTFGPPVTYPAPAPLAIASADLDDDLDQDLLIANTGESGSVTVLLSDGRGGFVPGASVPIGGRGNPFHAAVADLNGDGALDIATSMGNAGFGALSLRFGDGLGGFPTEEVIDFPTQSPGDLTVGDFTGDGRCDIALALLEQGGPIHVYPGQGAPAAAGTDPCRDRVRVPVGAMSGRILTPALTVKTGAPVTARMSLSRPAAVGGSFAHGFERSVPRRQRVLRAGRHALRFRAPSKAGRYVLTISAASLEGRVVRRGVRVVVRPGAK